MPSRQSARAILARNKDPALVTGRLSTQEFVAERRAEIEQLQAALDSSGPAKQRAFQKQPRVLRRRTASHNPSRVPKRSRERAKLEMAHDNTPVKKKRRLTKAASKKIGPELETGGQNGLPVNQLAEYPRPRKFADRQKNKVWVPTHVWHRKRAHMDLLWGYMVPTTPTQKQYRLTHRISDQMGGALAWDTSYYGTLVCFGDNIAHLAAGIAQICPGAEAPLHLQGNRSWQGLVKDDDVVLGPALLLWTAGGFVIHAHPAIYAAVFQLVVHTLASTNAKVYDCRYQVGSIDLVGSKALHSVYAVFKPRNEEANEDILKPLGAIATVDSLPYNGVLETVVQDPRILYPPSKQSLVVPTETMSAAIEKWSRLKQNPQVHPLWTEAGRQAAIDSMPTIQEINQRKKNRPGEHPPIYSSDPAVPVCIFKLSDSRVRILMPTGFVEGFWRSLASLPAVKLGGLAEFHQIAFERGTRFFPNDYPDTAAGQAFLEKADAQWRAAWHRRPPAKRPAYKTAVGDPFVCDWDLVGGPETLVPVLIEHVGRGTPSDRARVYSVPPGEEDKYLGVREKHAEPGPAPPAEFLIGFVTSGAHNLAEGRGTGIGMAKRADGMCLVQNVSSETVFPARLSAATAVVL